MLPLPLTAGSTRMRVVFSYLDSGGLGVGQELFCQLSLGKAGGIGQFYELALSCNDSAASRACPSKSWLRSARRELRSTSSPDKRPA